METVMKRTTLVLAVILLLLLLGTTVVFGQTIGEKAPDFKLEPVGGSVSLSDYTGKVVILHFWDVN